MIGWKVAHGDLLGNCTIRLSEGANDADLTVLHPLDNSADDKGSFACGRNTIDYE